jgi:KaiC/GvpD/RAD55 family RecA-like ATPase
MYLLEGDPGTGKTTLAMQFIMAGVQSGEKALYITLSESKVGLEASARSHGWKIEDLRRSRGKSATFQGADGDRKGNNQKPFGQRQVL